MPKEYDIVIVGAGFTGLCLAQLLDDLPLKILLIEKNSLQNMFNPNLDNRGIALSKFSCDLLQQLNVPPEIFDEDSKINKVHVTKLGSFGATDLASETNLGYVLDSAQLGQALIKPYTNVEFLEQVAINDLNYLIDDKLWSFKINEKNYTTKLLIGADGLNSIVRKILHIENHTVLENHGALICNVEISTDHYGVAHQRFIDQRILALLPFGKKRLKCILTFNDYQKTSLELNDLEYITLLQDLIGVRFKIIKVSKRLYYPVTQVQAKKIIAPNTVLIGNAANTLSPVAAQGLNLGLRDVAVLSKLLHDYGLNDLSSLLREYANKRHADHQKTNAFTKNIHKYMAKNSKLLPSVVLSAVELNPWLKQAVIKQNGYIR